MKLKRTFLLGLVVSVGLAALMGIYALISGQLMGDLEGKILLSTMTVGLFSLTSLVSALVYERGVWRPAMVAGLAVSGWGIATYLLGIWILFDLLSYPHQEHLGKLMSIQAVLAIALPHAGLLALTKFDKQPYRIIRLLSLLVIMLLAGVLMLAILVEFFFPRGFVFSRDRSLVDTRSRRDHHHSRFAKSGRAGSGGLGADDQAGITHPVSTLSH